MRESVVTAAVPTLHDGIVTWNGTLRPAAEPPASVTFAFSHLEPSGLGESARPFLLAFLLPAMRLGDPLVVDGPVGPGTIDNLMEWQEAMASWHPGQLTVVPIRAEDDGTTPAAPRPPGERRALMAFSGGLDSCFTAVRNAPRAAQLPGATSHRQTAATAGLMVHGFDIAVHESQAFRSAYDRSAAILRALGMAPLWLRTDVRTLEQRFDLSWETAGHGIWLVAALACLEGAFDQLLVPSTFTYGQQLLPWGSNPLTDPLLGSAATAVWHDGAAHDRLAKARAVAGSEPVLQGLRVCWEGDEHDRNCGRCYKCLTTQACFWLAGVDDPPCFHRPGTPADLAGVAFRSPFQLRLAADLRAEAERQGRSDLVAAIDQALSAG